MFNRKKGLLAFLGAISLMAATSCTKARSVEDDVKNHHVIITYLTVGNKPTNSGTSEMLEKLNEILTEKVNAELEIYYIPWSDYITNYNLKLAEKDGSIDLIGTATDWLDAWRNASLGNFYPLSEEMLSTYAPKTWNSVTPEHWNVCKLNDTIYMCPEDNYTQWTNHGFMYRTDWARQAGLNGVHSWEDLTKYLSYIRKNKPQITPWDSDASSSSFHPEGYMQSKTDFIVLDGISSTSMFGTHKNNLKKFYCPLYESDEIFAYAKLMRQWNDMGVWPKNVLIERGGNRSNRDEFCAGLTALEQHHSQTWYTQVVSKVQALGGGADSGFFWFGEESSNITYQTVTHGAMAVSSASKHPERALMVYDLLRNDKDCYELINYGIKGKNYTINSQGYREAVPNAKGITTNYWWGRNDALEVRDTATSWDKFDELNKIYGKSKIDYPYGQLVFDFSKIRSELDAVGVVYGNYMGNICYGQVRDTDAYVKRFKQDLKQAGIEKIITELQSQMDKFNSSRNSGK